MGRADSPLKDRMIFNVGARRSGTFWLQRIVTAHRLISAVPGETHLFSHGIAPLMERFVHGVRENAIPGNLWVERETLLDALRDFCDRVLSGHLEPGTTHLSERTPVHVSHLGLLGDLYPDGHVVHIIRDGRDVVRSLLRQPWGPDKVVDAAREWRSSVEAGRAARFRGTYYEIRYEDILADPHRRIRELFERLGVPADEAVLGAAVQEAGVEANLDRTRPDVGTGKWRTEFSRGELDDFEREAGDLLDELGYERMGATGRTTGRALARKATSLTPRRLRTRKGEVSPGSVWHSPAGGVVSLLDDLVAAMQDGRSDDAARLLSDDATLKLVDGTDRTVSRGDEARGRLAAAIAGDPALTGHQIRGDMYVRVSGALALLTYVLDDGSEAERIVAIGSDGERIASLTLYALPPLAGDAAHM